MMFKTRKKWERRKKMLKHAEARASTKQSKTRNGAAIDSCASKMKKLEADMEFLKDERRAIEDTSYKEGELKIKKAKNKT